MEVLLLALVLAFCGHTVSLNFSAKFSILHSFHYLDGGLPKSYVLYGAQSASRKSPDDTLQEALTRKDPDYWQLFCLGVTILLSPHRWR